jgi:ubiquinone/menaquinone biosynthesis C-methylase UbiE
MTDGVLESLDAQTATFPRAAAMIRTLLERSPMFLRGQLAYLLKERSHEFWPAAERLVTLAEDLGGSPAQSLVEYTVTYLKEQIRFIQTNEYSHSDFDSARKAVYDNPEVMEKFYLEGLMLTHAFWPIHLDIHKFFREEFVARVPEAGIGAEFGFGHGLYLLDVLQARPEVNAKGYDISEYSQRYAGKLLAHSGVAADRFQLGFADVRERLPAADGEFSWAIFAEIMEHIPDPLGSLRHLRRCLAPGAPVFVTTVLNSNALDHMYLFTEFDQVRAMLRDAGFSILVDRAFKVADYATAKDPSVDVVLVCTPDPSAS